MIFMHKFIGKKMLSVVAVLMLFAFAATASAQSYIQSMRLQSARSDKLTGGKIEKTGLAAGAGNLKITINIPAFQMTLWQKGREIKTYPIGVGVKDYPIFVGYRAATEIVWNPDWIPPDSDWVLASSKVKPGEIIAPTDPRNPLGKMKIPLGGGYLIHQAKGVGDLGNMVSHGCVRVMRDDLYDLSEKIIAAFLLPVTEAEIRQAKSTLKTFTAELEKPIPVEITYDTHVVEDGLLRIYPDIYERKTNTPEKLRDELETSGIKTRHLTDETLKQMLARAEGKRKFVVSVENIEKGSALSSGRTIAVIAQASEQKPKQVPRKKSRRKM